MLGLNQLEKFVPKTTTVDYLRTGHILPVNEFDQVMLIT